MPRSWAPVFAAALGACGRAPGGGDASEAARRAMVDSSIAFPHDGREAVADARVLEAFRRVPRHEFVPDAVRGLAYADRALPIGSGQTISQPYVVAKMTELLAPKPEHRVLEVGTGSGFQAAVLSGLVAEVYTIEIVEPLAHAARERLERLGYRNVQVRAGDGYLGWPEAAPFDGIVVTASATHLPRPLLEQLKPGGRLVIPAGDAPEHSELLVVHRGETADDVRVERRMAVAFVPLTGDRASSGPR